MEPLQACGGRSFVGLGENHLFERKKKMKEEKKKGILKSLFGWPFQPFRTAVGYGKVIRREVGKVKEIVSRESLSSMVQAFKRSSDSALPGYVLIGAGLAGIVMIVGGLGFMIAKDFRLFSSIGGGLYIVFGSAIMLAIARRIQQYRNFKAEAWQAFKQTHRLK